MTKVLIIEDDKSLRYTLGRILINAGYEVSMAGEGEHGLALFQQEKPDLVICDLNMPHVNGITTIGQLRAQEPGLKIIAISGGGHSMNADGLVKALETGADEIMMKPIRAADLISQIQITLGAAESPDAASDEGAS